MKSNQSLHLTIKEPPDPNPKRTLGVFDDLDNPSLPSIINAFISNTEFKSKATDFERNVTDEALKLLTKEKVIAVRREADTTIIYLTRTK